MSDTKENLFAALAEFIAEKPPEIKFYAYLDDRGNVIATGTDCVLEFAQQVEIDEDSHKLCIQRGVKLLELVGNTLTIKQAELPKNKHLVYYSHHTANPAVEIKVSGNRVTAQLTKKGQVELGQYANRGKITNKIWIVDGDHRHRCLAELKVGNDFVTNSAELEYISNNMIIATYPVFSSYHFEQE